MQTSIIMATYNKNSMLRNTLTGIIKQKTSFPYEVCIVDDGTEESPESIIREILSEPVLKFKRFDENKGPLMAKHESYKMSSPESQILINISSDVVMLDEDCIEKLCRSVGEKVFTVAEVNTMEMDSNMYKSWNESSENMRKIFYDIHPYFGTYCGSLKPGRWYVFLGAFRRVDAEDVGIFQFRDVQYRKNLVNGGYKCIYPMVKAMHQTHETKRYNN